MAIIFWLFLLFAPVMWIISFIILLVKKRPLTFLFNFLLCAIIIYLVWAGLGTEAEAVSKGALDDAGKMAGSILKGLSKGFASLVLAAGWGMSILIYSMLCSAAPKPELELLSDRINNRPGPKPHSGFTEPSPAPVLQTEATKRSNLVPYIIIGAVILYLLAKKATEMGL